MTQDQAASSDESLRGIGGWLILVAITTCLTPFIYIVYAQMVHGAATALPASERGPFYIGAVVSLLLAAAWVYAAFLFFNKRASFPKVFIVLSVLAVIKVIVLLGFLLMYGRPVAPVVHEVLRAVIHAAVWIPYMRVSRRVKATFVQ